MMSHDDDLPAVYQPLAPAPDTLWGYDYAPPPPVARLPRTVTWTLVLSALTMGACAIGALWILNETTQQVQDLTFSAKSMEAASSWQRRQTHQLRNDLQHVNGNLNTTTQQLQKVSKMAPDLSRVADAIEQARLQSELERVIPSMVPVIGGYQTAPFGLRDVHPVTGATQVQHAGIDLACAEGAIVMATADGTVEAASERGGYGLAIVLRHNHQIETLYGHLSSLIAKEGQTVRRGDPIGRIGATGTATGDHLHYEVRIDGTPVDPTPYLIPATALSQIDRLVNPQASR